MNKIINTLQKQIDLAKDMNHRNIVLSVEEAEILIGLMRNVAEKLNNIPDKITPCKDCKHAEHCEIYAGWDGQHLDWFCADGEKE